MWYYAGNLANREAFMKKTALNRRAFTQAALTGLVAPFIVPARAWGKTEVAPSERVNVGIIGLGGIGMGHVGRFLRAREAHIVAVCDVHKLHYRDMDWEKRTPCGRDAAKELVERYFAKEMEQGTYKGCATYNDFRELCARDDIDAVVIATPDHWHARITMEALRQGKDVYCEKPVTHLFAEARTIIEEVQQRKAIFQTGSQQRSSKNFRLGVELVRNGHLGKITHMEVGLPQGHAQAQGDTTLTDAPADLDYDLWCGPSEKLPYMRARHHRWWRFHRAYGGGNIMDWIGHHNDIAHWGIGMEESGPVEVAAHGEWVWPTFTGYNTPVHYDIRCRFEDGCTSSISDQHRNGVKWIGEDGWLWMDRRNAESSNPALLERGFDPGPIKVYESKDHVRNFIEGIKTRKECVAPPHIAHRSITPGYLGYIAQELGRPLQWDADQEQVKDDDAVNALLNAIDYRAPWSLD